MIREPSLMSQEIKPMDLMEVIKVCFSFFFLPSFSFLPPPVGSSHDSSACLSQLLT